MITLAAYVGISVVLLMLGFVLPSRAWRRFARISAAAMAVPIVLLVLVLGGFSVSLFTTAPPTLDQLEKRFPGQQHDLQTIVEMSNQDSRFSRIAPDFLDQNGTSRGRYMADDLKAELPKARWDAYRAIFKRNHIELGIQRDDTQDAFIMFNSQGLLDRGYATGIVYCADPGSTPKPDSFRYEPCATNEPSGSGLETENPHREAFAFRKLNGRWYAYSQGPG